MRKANQLSREAIGSVFSRHQPVAGGFSGHQPVAGGFSRHPHVSGGYSSLLPSRYSVAATPGNLFFPSQDVVKPSTEVKEELQRRREIAESDGRYLDFSKASEEDISVSVPVPKADPPKSKKPQAPKPAPSVRDISLEELMVDDDGEGMVVGDSPLRSDGR